MMAQGKQSDQKMKPYLVYEYLMRYSDANHVVSANELVGYLQEYGIPRAETVEKVAKKRSRLWIWNRI